MTWLTTTSILNDLRGDPQHVAWRLLLERFRGPAVRFAVSMGHSAVDAEDVIQDAFAAFTAAYRAGRYDREKGRLSVWLFGFVHRAALHARSQRERPRAVGGPSYFERLADRGENGVTETTLEPAWEGFLLQECLERARRELTAQTFAAFELTAIRGVPAAEAARRLGVPITVIYNAKHRVASRVRELRELMEE